MRRAVLLALLSFGLAGTRLPAQTNPEPPPAPPVVHGKPIQVQVHLIDGSVVKMTLNHPAISVSTRFGNLTVPAGAVRQIEVGLRYPPGLKQRIEQAVRQLGDARFDRRVTAEQQLLGWKGFAYPFVRDAAETSDAEVAQRAAGVLEKLRRQLGEDELNAPRYDVIDTTEFRIVGQITDEVLRVRSPFFRDEEMPLANIRSVRWLTGEEREFVVEAARYGLPQEAWLDTGIQVEERTLLKVRAAGEVDLYPIGNEANVYVGGPGGPKRWGRDAGRPTPHPPGSLLGKIGPGGSVFVLGEKYAEPARQSGSLFLRIAPSPWNVNPTGSYTVKVAVE